MSKKVLWIVVIVIIAIGGISYGCSSDAKESENSATAKDDQKQKKAFPAAPDFALKDLEGSTIKLSDYQGKVVILDFWATWCGPCRRGIPEFIELQSEFGEDDLVILGISVDRGDLSVVPKFAKQFGINYPVLYANEDIQRKYGPIRSIPTAFIVDKEGKVRDMTVGLRPKSYFKKVIDSLL